MLWIEGDRMETYYLVKSVVVVLLSVLGVTLFAHRVRRLLNLMRSVQGKAPPVLDRIGRRLRKLFTEVLLQTRVRRSLLPGLAHVAIFYGFLVVQVHSTEFDRSGENINQMIYDIERYGMHQARLWFLR